MRILAFLKAIVEGFRVAPQRPDIPEGVMTLQINAAKWIPNPSDDQILNELARLRDEDGDSFHEESSATDLTYIQAAGDARVGFDSSIKRATLTPTSEPRIRRSRSLR